MDELTVDPSQSVATTVSDRICLLGCLGYTRDDAPPRWQQARDLLNPAVELDIWAAAAAGDAERVRSELARDPDLVDRRGGPHHWTPLLYLAYSRMGTGDPIATAQALLEAGADPNTGYLWAGVHPFTALTGVFGKGEQGSRRQPPHPDKATLAALLLEAGAHPTDSQALYNCMFTPDDDHLELLFAHGLGGTQGPWFQVLGDRAESWPQILDRQLGWAADHGFEARLALFAAHGVDLDAPLADGRTPLQRLADHQAALADQTDVNALVDGATALHRAAWDGDLPRIRQLFSAGADQTIKDERFDATPLGWAEHAYQDEAAAVIRELTQQRASAESTQQCSGASDLSEQR